MDKATFLELVAEVLEGLPDDIRAMMDNVEVVVEDWASAEELLQAGVDSRYNLLGLYHGIPLTQRSSHYGMVLPDKITLYQRAIELHSGPGGSLRRRIRQTILHELAHHFGIDDDRLHEIGRY